MCHREEERARHTGEVGQRWLVDQRSQAATSGDDARPDVVLDDVAMAGPLSPDVVAHELDEERVATGCNRRASRQVRCDAAFGVLDRLDDGCGHLRKCDGTKSDGRRGVGTSARRRSAPR